MGIASAKRVRAKLSKAWRIVAALCGVALFATAFIGWLINADINCYYFKQCGNRLSILGGGLLFLGSYAALVTITGHLNVFPLRSQTRESQVDKSLERR